MRKLGAWLQASRPLAQANVAVPLIFGQALALRTCERFSWAAFGVAVAFGVAAQLFIVYGNDAADWESDAQNRTYNQYSGGSRVVAEGKLQPRQLLTAAAGALGVMLLLAAVAGVALGRPWLAAVVAVTALLVWAYSFAPLRISYRGHGEWLQAIGVGAVLPIAGFYLQCPSVAALPWEAIVPSLVLGWAGNVTTALPDTPSDAATAKRTYPVRRGQLVARRDSLIAVAAAAIGTPLVLPGASWLTVLLAAIPSLGLLAANLRELPGANAENRVACTRFVTRNGAAITLLLVSWSLALAYSA